MRNYEYREKPAEKYKLLKECICDLCGHKSTELFNDPERYGDYSQITVEMQEGTCYPESHSYTTTYYDICPNCFKNKIMRFLNNEGASPTEENNDW